MNKRLRSFVLALTLLIAGMGAVPLQAQTQRRTPGNVEVGRSKFHDALNRSTTTGKINRLHDRAATKAVLTDILLGATVIAGGVTLFFALTGRNRSDKPPVAAAQRARLNVGLGSLELSGQF